MKEAEQLRKKKLKEKALKSAGPIKSKAFDVQATMIQPVKPAKLIMKQSSNLAIVKTPDKSKKIDALKKRYNHGKTAINFTNEKLTPLIEETKYNSLQVSPLKSPVVEEIVEEKSEE